MNIVLSLSQIKHNIVYAGKIPIESVQVVSLATRFNKKTILPYLVVLINQTNHYMVFDKICDRSVIYKPVFMTPGPIKLPVADTRMDICIFDTLGNYIYDDIEEKRFTIEKVKCIDYDQDYSENKITVMFEQWYNSSDFLKGEKLSCSKIPGVELVVESVENIANQKSKILNVFIPEQYFDELKGRYVFDPCCLLGGTVINTSKKDSLILTI